MGHHQEIKRSLPMPSKVSKPSQQNRCVDVNTPSPKIRLHEDWPFVLDTLRNVMLKNTCLKKHHFPPKNIKTTISHPKQSKTDGEPNWFIGFPWFSQRPNRGNRGEARDPKRPGEAAPEVRGSERSEPRKMDVFPFDSFENGNPQKVEVGHLGNHEVENDPFLILFWAGNITTTARELCFQGLVKIKPLLRVKGHLLGRFEAWWTNFFVANGYVYIMSFSLNIFESLFNFVLSCSGVPARFNSSPLPCHEHPIQVQLARRSKKHVLTAANMRFCTGEWP